MIEPAKRQESIYSPEIGRIDLGPLEDLGSTSNKYAINDGVNSAGMDYLTNFNLIFFLSLECLSVGVST